MENKLKPKPMDQGKYLKNRADFKRNIISNGLAAKDLLRKKIMDKADDITICLSEKEKCCYICVKEDNDVEVLIVTTNNDFNYFVCNNCYQMAQLYVYYNGKPTFAVN